MKEPTITIDQSATQPQKLKNNYCADWLEVLRYPKTIQIPPAPSIPDDADGPSEEEIQARIAQALIDGPIEH